MQKIDFMNAVSRFEYAVNMMFREQILLMQKKIYQCKKIDPIIVKFKPEKAFKFGF